MGAGDPIAGEVTEPAAQRGPRGESESAARGASEAASSTRAGRATLSAPRAAMAAWCAVGLVNAATIAATLPLPGGGVRVRALHHFYDLGHMIAMGLATAGAVAAWERWGAGRPEGAEGTGKRRSRLRAAAGYGVLAAVSIGLGFVLLWEDLFGFAQRVNIVVTPAVLHPASIVLVALGVPGAALAGRLLARFWPLRIAGAAAALAIAIANHWVLRNDYPGAHFYMAAAAVALGTASAAGAALPWRRRPGRGASVEAKALETQALEAPGVEAPAAATPAPARSRLLRLGRWAVQAAIALAAAASLVVPPRRAVLAELRRASGCILAPFVLRPLPSPPPPKVAAPIDAGEWFQPRAHARAVPPSSPALLPKNGVVVLMTIDAVRADVFRREKYARRLPAIRALQEQSVDFTLARSPGSQTVYSLTTLFSGTYFFQQYWTRIPGEKDNYVWPHKDSHTRFPELLGRAGIPTVNYAAAMWLRNKWGVVRGFSEEHLVETDQRWAPASALGDAAVARIRKHEGGPLFLYLHFFDPHRPYDSAGVKGSSFDKYVGEIGLVDAQMKRILDALDEKGLTGRSVVIVTTDHGEAFGEHNSYAHANTLYEEQIRIPLFIRGPGISPRKVDHPVSLVDLGPTILDLMGLPTPGHFMGQSLVPFLRGEDPVLTRPIFAEGRLKRTMVFPDGVKAIADDHNDTVEVYDLKKDPDELRNLYDEENETAERVALLRKFIEVHLIRKRGYKIPFRK